MKQTHKLSANGRTNWRNDGSQVNNVHGVLGATPTPMGGVLLDSPILARLTKYTGLVIFAIVIVSVITLNIIASYSNSKITAGAEPAATLATNVDDAASISLSIHSATDSCDTSTSANPAADVCLQIPDGGGIAVGRHTIAVTSNSYAGYSVTVEGSGGSTDMAASDFGSDETSSNNELIKSTNATIANPATLNINTWGIAIPNDSPYSPYDKYSSKSIYDVGITNPNDQSTQTTLAKATFGAVPPKLAGETIMSSSQATGTNHDGSSSDNQNIYYGANVEQFFRAGTYSEEVVYTATVNLPPTPTNLSVLPTTYEFDSCNDSLITIKGTNLSSAYEVYLQKSGTSDEANRLACTNLNLDSTNNQLTCNIPTSRDEVELNTIYDIYVISQAANPGVLKNAFTYTEPATGISVKSTSENIIVDYDENLIPVAYVGYDGNGGGHWESLTKGEIASDTDNWFNYTNKQWANAVTVTKESLSEYQDKHTTIDNNDVLGYWVYIPRYAYEVMRPNAVDRVVDDDMAEEEGGFNIHFETVNDTKKIPAESCNLGITTAAQMWDGDTPVSSAGPTNTNIRAKDYRTGCGIDRTYPGNDATKSNGQTTWATHPAFTWGDTELNGLWVGKFETTGKVNAPTVKPNQHANIREYIGEFSTMAKSIGKEDKCNVGGNAISGIEQNSHNLQTTKSHMLKNSEWGAVAYLSASKYGVGVNGTKTNSAYPATSADADISSPSSSYRNGITGCGPKSKTSESSYSSVTVNGETVKLPALSANHIEDPLACGDKAHAYNGEIGVLASTTNTIYGIYDMSGGAYEHVMGNLTGYDNQSETSRSSYMTTQAKPPYVDLYKESPYGNFTSGVSSGAANNPVGWGASVDEYYWNNDVCTWETCGGHALHETKQYQSVSSNYQSWGGDSSNFAYSSFRWFLRGGSARSVSNAGLFVSGGSDGISTSSYGFRAALLALPQG